MRMPACLPTYIPIHGQSYISQDHCENGYLTKKKKTTTIFLNQFPQTRHQLIKIKPLWIFETTRNTGDVRFIVLRNSTHLPAKYP